MYNKFNHTTIAFLLLTISCFSCSKKEKTIFNIPLTATPSELEKNGFTIERNLNFLGKTDGHLFDGKIDRCVLDQGTCVVSVSYPENDTNYISEYNIHIEYLAFKLLTKKEPKSYKKLELDGVNYKVTDHLKARYLTLKRLD